MKAGGGPRQEGPPRFDPTFSLDARQAECDIQKTRLPSSLQLDIAQAEAEQAVQPGGVADPLGW